MDINESANNNPNNDEWFLKGDFFGRQDQSTSQSTPQKSIQRKSSQIFFDICAAFIKLFLYFVEPPPIPKRDPPPSIHLSYYYRERTSSESFSRHNLEHFKNIIKEIQQKYWKYLYSESLEMMVDADKVAQRFEMNNENADFFRCYYNMKGDIMMMTKRYEEAEDLFNKSLKIINEYYPDNNFHQIYSLSNLGELYYRQGKFKESETLLTKGLELREQEKQRLNFGYVQLTRLYTEWGKLDKAREYLKKSLENTEQFTEKENKFFQGRYHRNLGQIQFKENDFFGAKESYLKAIGLVSEGLPEGNDLTRIFKEEYEQIVAKEPEFDIV